MFCWGSTIHGELGLGGIEDENIFIPREIDFKKASDIEQSKFSKRTNIFLCQKVPVYIIFCCTSGTPARKMFFLL